MPQTDSNWFYADGATQIGPVSLAQLQQLVTAGTVTPATMVWTSGMAAWSPAGQVAALFAPGSVPPSTIGYAHQRPGEQRDIGQDAGIRMLIPVGRSGWAIGAGYAGLFALIPFFAPIALIVGTIAVIHLKRRPDLHGWPRAIFGLVMGIVFSILLLMMIIAIAMKK